MCIQFHQLSGEPIELKIRLLRPKIWRFKVTTLVAGSRLKSFPNKKSPGFVSSPQTHMYTKIIKRCARRDDCGGLPVDIHFVCCAQRGDFLFENNFRIRMFKISILFGRSRLYDTLTNYFKATSLVYNFISFLESPSNLKFVPCVPRYDGLKSPHS